MKKTAEKAARNEKNKVPVRVESLITTSLTKNILPLLIKGGLLYAKAHSESVE